MTASEMGVCIMSLSLPVCSDHRPKEGPAVTGGGLFRLPLLPVALCGFRGRAGNGGASFATVVLSMLPADGDDLAADKGNKDPGVVSDELSSKDEGDWRPLLLLVDLLGLLLPVLSVVRLLIGLAGRAGLLSTT